MEVSDMIKTIEYTLCEHSIVMNNVGGKRVGIIGQVLNQNTNLIKLTIIILYILYC